MTLILFTSMLLGCLALGMLVASGEVMSKVIALTAQPPLFFVSPRLRSGETLTAFWRSLVRMQLHDRRRITRRLEMGERCRKLHRAVHRLSDAAAVHAV